MKKEMKHSKGQCDECRETKEVKKYIVKDGFPSEIDLCEDCLEYLNEPNNCKYQIVRKYKKRR